MVQLCDSDEMLAAGAAYFLAQGIERGEAIVLTGTPPHLKQVRRALRAYDVDADALERRGQLFAGDALEAAHAVMVDGRLDPKRFDAIASEVLTKARSDARYSGVRWWGEMSNVFNQLGLREAMIADEDIGDAVARKHGVSLLCSFQCDRFDAASYDGLHEVCRRHSHVIPGVDYDLSRAAVNRAIADVIGDIEGPKLRSLLAWQAPACALPSWQALLFWVRDAMPERFAAVLSAAKSHHAARASEASR